MKKHTAPPIIELLKPSELTVEKDFNPREAAQFKDNVKEVRASIEARGFIDPSIHVVQYVERDGKKLVRGGHTLLEAAKTLGLKEVPACKTDLDPISEQVNLITSNTGHPLSKYEQGTVYVRLRDGELRKGLEWGENGQVKEGKKERALDEKKDFYRVPMTGAEIAVAIGCSEEYISQCFIVRECPPEIAEKMLAGKIGVRALLKALRNVNMVEKQIKIVNAAIAAAKEDGKDCATVEHVKAVKDQFMEKKQVAAPVTTTTETTSTNKDTVKETKTSKPNATPSTPEPPAPDLFKEGDAANGEPAHPLDHTGKELSAEMKALYDGKVPEGKADLVKRVISVIDFWSVDLPNVNVPALTGEEIEILAVAIVKTLETPI